MQVQPPERLTGWVGNDCLDAVGRVGRGGGESLVDVLGDFHDQGDAKWIVFKRLL
jgi:hypothetical protein